MKDDKNYNWTFEEIAQQYQVENPEWNWNKCLDKAKIIHKELKKLNDDMWRSNKLYFKMNKPFSFFGTRDDEFSDTYYDFKSRE